MELASKWIQVNNFVAGGEWEKDYIRKLEATDFTKLSDKINEMDFTEVMVDWAEVKWLGRAQGIEKLGTES